MYQADLLDHDQAWMSISPVVVGTVASPERFSLTVSTFYNGKETGGFGLNKARARELVDVLTGWIERDEMPDAPAKLV